MTELIPVAHTLVADILTWTIVVACLLAGRGQE